MIKLGIIGYGYWGPNIARNFQGLEDVELCTVCDIDAKQGSAIHRNCPGVTFTTDPNEVLTSLTLDAVAIVTPVSTHFPLAKAALKKGKHVFIEKPFTATVPEAEELIELAEN